VESSARFVIGSALMRRASRSGRADEVEENRSLGKAWGDSDSGLRAALATTPGQVRSLVALGEQMADARRAALALRPK
jgi:hypothetical protein